MNFGNDSHVLVKNLRVSIFNDDKKWTNRRLGYRCKYLKKQKRICKLDIPTQLVKSGKARVYPTGQTPVVNCQSLVLVIPGVGGPSYEQPCPTTAPRSIKMAYEPFILNAA